MCRKISARFPLDSRYEFKNLFRNQFTLEKKKKKNWKLRGSFAILFWRYRIRVEKHAETCGIELTNEFSYYCYDFLSIRSFRPWFFCNAFFNYSVEFYLAVFARNRSENIFATTLKNVFTNITPRVLHYIHRALKQTKKIIKYFYILQTVWVVLLVNLKSVCVDFIVLAFCSKVFVIVNDKM